MRRRVARIYTGAITLSAVVVVGAITQAGAASFSVTNTNASGAGSLTQAIIAANNAGGADTIDFAPGVAGTIPLAETITGPTTIVGPGTGVVTISGRLDIATTATATVSGLTIDGIEISGGDVGSGSATGGIGGDGDGGPGGDAEAEGGEVDETGGGVVLNAGDLILDRVVVTGGRGVGGRVLDAGIGIGGRGGNGGSMGNPGGPGGRGIAIPGAVGAVTGVGIFNSGSMTIRASTVSGNSAVAGDGGDATATGGNGGTGNGAGGFGTGGKGGAGIAGGIDGGDVLGVGIYNAGSMTIEASTITNNTATGGSGGDARAQGGNGGGGTSGLGGMGGSATATGGAGGDAVGAGIFNEGALQLRNSTISANTTEPGVAAGTRTATTGNPGSGGSPPGGEATATAGAPGIASGAGFANQPAVGQGATLNSVTFATNKATSGANLSSTGTLTIVNSIVTNPTSGPSCAGSITSGGFNIDSGTTCGFTQPSDQQSTDPQLGLLQDNGGPTATQLPTQTSPAIDRGSSGGLTTDQRGLSRPSDFATIGNAAGGDGSDIGAVELTAPPQPFTVEVMTSKKLKGTKLRATVTCSKDCEIDAQGKGKAGGDKFKTKPTSLSLAAGAPTLVKLKLKKRDRDDVAGEKGKATISVAATAGAETALDSAKVKLKP